MSAIIISDVVKGNLRATHKNLLNKKRIKIIKITTSVLLNFDPLLLCNGEVLYFVIVFNIRSRNRQVVF